MISLLSIILFNSITLFAIFVIFVRSLWSLFTNVTTIESWEIERHDALIRRARHRGGFLDGPDGTKIRIKKQEFPYDIGILANVAQGMSGGLLTWLWPFTGSTSFHEGLIFPVNGFEGESQELLSRRERLIYSSDTNVTWPPPDPDRMSRKDRFTSPPRAFMHYQDSLSAQEQVKAFQQRQQHDLKRNRQETTSLANDGHHPESFKELHVQLESDRISKAKLETVHPSQNLWRNNEGDNLNDFGVDEDAEFYDEDEVPISQLLRKRKRVVQN